MRRRELMGSPILGIDLGTRYALSAVARPERPNAPVLVPNRWGNVRTPSYVARTDSQGWIAGEDAARIALREPRKAWWNVKRHVGDPAWRVRLGRKEYGAEELLAPLLTLLREDAEAFLCEYVTSCVLAVPAHFSFPERAAMMRVAKTSGFSEVKIVNEPTAAALAVGGEGRFLVLDFGAGTVDVTVVEREGQVWQVIDSIGRGDLGGADLDVLLAEWLWSSVSGEKPDREDPRWAVLLAEAEQMKITLSDALRAVWYPPGGLFPGEPVSREVDREQLEALMQPPIAEVVGLVRKLWRRHAPEKLLLVGGSSRIPLLRRALSAGVAEPDHLRMCPDEAVAIGAALCAYQSGERLLIDVLSGNLGVEVADGSVVVLLEQGMPLPASASRRFATIGSGGFTVSVVQTERRGGSRRFLGSVHVDADVKGAEVEVHFLVDSGGVLRVEVCRRGGRVITSEVLDITGGGAAADARRREDLPALERRLARLSLALSPEQQGRISVLLGKVQILKDEGSVSEEALLILRHMVEDLEKVVHE
jgi:molecular chaperone DnaK (HSP70)